MKAVRFVAPGGEARVGALDGERVRDAGPAGPRGFVPTEEAWLALAAADGPEHALGDVRLLHPVVPEKILAIGVNYRSHAEESELEVPQVPVVFAKWASALIGPDDEIVIPREETRPDFEGEVAVVLGERVYRADEEQARRAIGGITAIHDVSGRRAQLETPLRQFTLGKSFDTFSPLGPCIASPDGLDFDDIRLTTTVSGEVMQDASTSDLVFGFVDLDRLPLQGPHPRSRRRDRDGDAGRRRRLAHPAALPGGGRRRRGVGRRRGDAAQPGSARASEQRSYELGTSNRSEMYRRTCSSCWRMIDGSRSVRVKTNAPSNATSRRSASDSRSTAVRGGCSDCCRLQLLEQAAAPREHGFRDHLVRPVVEELPLVDVRDVEAAGLHRDELVRGLFEQAG